MTRIWGVLTDLGYKNIRQGHSIDLRISMKISHTKFAEVVVIEPDIFRDERGFFFESFNQKKFNDLLGLKTIFLQDNHSFSIKNVFRGLHYQLPPAAQGKLVRVVSGVIFDIAVDIRKGSAFFSQWVGVELSAENRKQLWIPPGFAHGFLTLSDTAEVIYKTTDYYNPSCERVLDWRDVSIDIKLPQKSIETAPIIISSKDQEKAQELNKAEVFQI